MKYLKLYESIIGLLPSGNKNTRGQSQTKEIINIDNGEVLSMDINIFNKLSDKHIIVWDKDIEQHVYSDEFSSLIKDYILKHVKPEVKKVNPKEKIQKRQLNKYTILVGHYYTCKISFYNKKVHETFKSGEKYKVLDTLYHGKDQDNYVFIRYYKEKKPIKFKMNIVSFNKHFEE